MVDMKEPIPVTILSGFLGSGKTTLLQHILTSKDHKMKVAVIVNDMAELNIDASTVEQSGVVQAKKEVISLENGCICCTLRGDLIREINHIQELGNFDYVLIESTGIAEPQQVAESFCADPETAELADDPSKMLWNVARLDTCVTVIDAHDFPRQMASLKRFKEEFKDGMEGDDDEEGEKSIAELLVEQVEFANVILLNKTDLVSAEKKDSAIKLVKSLNPKAKIIPTTRCKVDYNNILNTKLFDMEEAEQSPGWLVSLQAGNTTSESDEYGVSSFVYRARKPFHPARLFGVIDKVLHFAQNWNKGHVAAEEERAKTMTESFGNILRSKGFCWIAGRESLTGGWHHSGRIVTIDPLQPWYATLPEEEWDVEDEEAMENIKNRFEGEGGDRRQEIVFIGTDLKAESIIKALDACLLTDEEMKSHDCSVDGGYYDRLPAWVVSYDEPSVVSALLRKDQVHKFHVIEGLQLTLSNLALDVDESDSFRPVVKVWLDLFDGKRPVLLATLRAGSSDQSSISVTIPGTAEDTHAVLRAEVKSCGSKRSFESESIASIEEIKVHVMGSVSPMPIEVEEHDHDHEEHEEGDACGHGKENCPLQSRDTNVDNMDQD